MKTNHLTYYKLSQSQKGKHFQRYQKTINFNCPLIPN